MNRTLKESLTGGRNVTVGSLNRRGPGHKDSDDKLDLFSKNRRTLSVASSDESDLSVKLGRLSVGSVKVTRNGGVDDLLSSTDGGKHDYDWLLTPPETPLPSSDGSETRPSLTAPRRDSFNRSASVTKTSRLSVTHSESNHSSRPVRSSSVTRSSVSNIQYNNYNSSYTNKSTSILNTSSSSVSSYSRPSTPTRSSSSIARPSTPTRSSSSIARPSTPTSRSVSSRSSTPSKTRPGPSNSSSSIDRTKPSQTSRPQIPAISNPLASRSVSRPSTPTRRNPPPSTPNLSPASTSNGRFPTSSSRPSSPNKQTRPTAPSSRPSSPSSRPRPTAPLVLPDFPLDAPPNLRTSLPPDRPLSAGRSRPGSVNVTSKANVEAQTPSNLTRRQSSSPIRRLSETSTRGRVHGNGQITDSIDSHSSLRKPIKTTSSTTSMENNGFGRNISKKSMDMALRHMDIRNGPLTRSLAGSSLFPQSIRPANKGQANRVSNGNLSIYDNGHSLDNADYLSSYHENGFDSNRRLSNRTSEPEIYESSRYDAILLKEDLKNTNWLHSIDDISDQGSIFDHGFEHLPEPFDPL